MTINNAHFEKFEEIFNEKNISAKYNAVIYKKKMSFNEMIGYCKNYEINICEIICEDYENYRNLYIIEDLINTINGRFNVDFTIINSEYYLVIRKETIDENANLGTLLFKHPCKIFKDGLGNMYIKTIKYGNIYLHKYK